MMDTDRLNGPGQFEGAPLWTRVAFRDYEVGEWEGLEGMAYTEVDASDRKAWDLADSTVAVVLVFGDGGHVDGQELTGAGFDDFLRYGELD